MKALTSLAATAALGVALLAPAPPADAGRARPGDSAYTHDGLLVRLAVGFGYTSSAVGDGGSGDGKLALTGGGGFASLAIGGMLTENLTLNADLFGLASFEPSVELGGERLGSLADTRMSVGAVGIGLTYYLTPANVYFAGSFGAAVGTLETRGRVLGVTYVREAKSDVGFAINLMVGKEWWVGREWGLGVAGQLILGSLPTESGEDISVFGLGVLFSATYN